MHELSYRVILKRLLVGVLRKDASVEDMMRVNVASLFMMHGLGHLIGLNVHDVGGYMEGRHLNVLNWRDIALANLSNSSQNMCLTVEPGIYFNSRSVQSK